MTTVLLVCGLCVSGCYDTVSVDLFPDAGFDAGTDADIPDADIPDADIPDADIPDADIPDAEIPDADIPDAEIPDADIPDAEIPDAGVPIMGCMDLCDTVIGWSSAQMSCIAQVLRLAGYAPGATPACRLIRDPQECMDCADGMGVSETVCIGVAFICLP